ncbi:MAG: glycosyltransferase [Verrucomicrobiota bacterium]
MKRANVVITFDSHTPYLAYRVRELQGALERRGLLGRVRMRVILLGAKESSYDWDEGDLAREYGGVPVTVLTDAFHGLGIRAYLSGAAARTCWKLAWELVRTRPKLVFVGGYDRPASLMAALLGIGFRWKTGPMHDSRFNDAESFAKRIFLEAMKAPFMRLYPFFMCSGRECVEYTRFLAGVKRPAYYAGWNVVDNASIAANADDGGRDVELLEAFGLEWGESFFFMPIRFLPKKNIFRVIAAYGNCVEDLVKAGEKPVPLVIAGKGPLREEALERIRERGLEKLIRVVDWVPYELVPRACRLSSAVILASTHDQWGLIVNEALSAGAPVLVSNRCGAHELVRNYENGFTFDPYDVVHLGELMLELSTGEELVVMLRSDARVSMDRFSIDQFLEAWFAVFQRYDLIGGEGEASDSLATGALRESVDV